MLMHSKRLWAAVLTVAVIAPLLLVGGCASRDTATYQSRVESPKTVFVRDVYTREVLWRYEVPVGYDLFVNLVREGEDETGISQIELLPATEVRWRLRRSGGWGTAVVDRGTYKLPGTPAITGFDRRPTPEFPPDYVPPDETFDATPWHIGAGGIQPAQQDRGAPREQR